MSDTREKFSKCVPNARLTDPVYPRCKVNGESPYDEQIMSMPSVFTNSVSQNSDTQWIKPNHIKAGHYFFFLFNMDNYYHFLYDTLPYLYFFNKVRKHHPTCRLLVESSWKAPRAFQKETMNLLGFTDEDMEFAEENMCYEFLHISSSLTHGKRKCGISASNDPPSSEAFTTWQDLAKAEKRWNCPSKIYISRRSWVHGQMDNIGTNYTTRRRCMNEDDLVKMLQEYGFQEVFCELLTMSEKIYMFQKATHIVGFIGGGMANLLFSPPTTRSACIPTPDFLRINTRFQFSMNHTNIHYIAGTELAPYSGPISLYTRVQTKEGRIGEIVGFVVTKGRCKVQWPEKAVAGFSLEASYTETEEDPTLLKTLDYGLNSPFVCDVDRLREWCETYAK